ncbi:MAG TPA: hypothetical protein VNJ52_05100 [Patescibacteria group bacterium]|nr:hypothetical protein [Patescibacteria group bacterium]
MTPSEQYAYDEGYQAGYAAGFKKGLLAALEKPEEENLPETRTVTYRDPNLIED